MIVALNDLSDEKRLREGALHLRDETVVLVPVIAVLGQDKVRRGKINHHCLTRILALHFRYSEITWRGMRFLPLGLRSGLSPNPVLLQSRETPCLLGRAPYV